MKKYILALDDTQRSFQCFAIQSDLEDYKLAFCINSLLNISLERIPDHTILDKNKVEYSFTAYMYDDEARMAIWSLISNVSHPKLTTSTQSLQDALFNELESIHQVRLIPDFKGIHYWLIIDCEELDVTAEIKTLRMHAGITSISKVEIQSSKHWPNLLLY